MQKSIAPVTLGDKHEDRCYSMPNITFEHPTFALAAILAPFAIVIGRRFVRSAFSLSLSLGAPGGEVFHPPIGAGFLGRLCLAAKLSGFILLLAAAAGPILISPSVVWIDRGTDILFVLDCSPSMAGLDIAGKSRFEASSELIKSFSAGRPSDAIGLVGLGNEAALIVPPSTDRTTLYSRMDKLRIGELGDGTALGMGLSVAALHLAGSEAPRKAVILITDGENNAGAIHPETAAETLAAAGIPLYIIAVGSTGEVPIDYVDPFSNVRRTGSFDSRYNPEALSAVADAGGGVFIPAPSSAALEAAFARLAGAEVTVSRSGMREKKFPVHTQLIVAGTVLAAAGELFSKLVLGAFL